MNKNSKKYISSIITLLVLILFGIYIYKNPNILTSLAKLDFLHILLTILIFNCIFFLEGLFIKFTLDAFDKKISHRESFYIATLSRIGNYLLPLRAGAVFRATYLKNKYDFKYSKFLSTLYAYYVILFLIYSILGLVALGCKWIFFNEKYIVLITFFALLLAGMLFLIFIRIPFRPSATAKNKFINKIIYSYKNFSKGWDRIRQDKRLLGYLFLITSGNITLNIILFAVEFSALNISTNFTNLLIYASLSGVSLLISLTPGSLGIRETMFLVFSQSLGLLQMDIMQLAIVDRAILFVLLLAILILANIFFKNLSIKDVFFPKSEN